MVDVVNIKKCPNFGLREGDVYIGRAHSSAKYGTYPESPWSNPYQMSQDTPEFRKQVCEHYQVHIDAKLARKELSIDTLVHAKRLGCWCKPKQCHGDYLALLIERRREEIVLEMIEGSRNTCTQMTKKS